MQRGRSQVIWRYMPGATFRYNESGGWCEVSDVTIRNPAPLSSALAGALSNELRRWQAVGPTGYPDPLTQPAKFEVGEPYDVRYSVWPTVFTCRSCGRAHWYRDIDRLRAVNDRMACQSCRGQAMLRQVPYAYVCECGRKEAVYIQKHEQDHVIRLVDKGSFQESYWFCTVCRQPLQRNAREGLGFRGCECQPKKAKRGVVLQDTRVYYSQSIEIVEVEPITLEHWRQNPRFSDLLLAASLGLTAYQPRHILDLARGPAKDGNAPGTIAPEVQAMRTILKRQGKSEADVEAMIAEVLAESANDPWAPYEAQLAPHRATFGGLELSESRESVEFVFVRDEPSMATIAVDRLEEEARAGGDTETANRLESERELAAELGLVDLTVVEASARSSLTVAAPYLSPAGMKGLKNAVGVAAQSGAAIRLVTSDLDGEGQRNRQAVRELVSGVDGNRIRGRLRVLTASEALPSLLHAKVVIADRARGYLGSANFSWRGMESNLEIGVPLDRQQAEAVDDMISYLEAKSLLHEVSP